MARSALIAGATGLVGGHLLRRLLESEPYARVVVLTRRDLGIDHPKLEQRIIDFELLQTVGLPATDDVFCCLGTTIAKAGSQEAFRRVDHDYVVDLALSAWQAGASQFLMVSSIGADENSRNFYLRVKGEAESDVRRVPFAGIQIFRPSLLLGDRTESRPRERLAAVLMKPISFLFLRGPLRRYRPVQADHVAATMLVAALRGCSGVRVVESERMRG